MIDGCNSVEEVIHNPLLLKFFMQLTKSNEALRCLHYLFRVKCERIDTSFFTVKNLQRTYQRYKEMAQGTPQPNGEEHKASVIGETGSMGSARMSNVSTDSATAAIKIEREQAFYKEMFI